MDNVPGRYSGLLLSGCSFLGQLFFGEVEIFGGSSPENSWRGRRLFVCGVVFLRVGGDGVGDFPEGNCLV